MSIITLWKKDENMHNYCMYSKVKPPWHLYFMRKGQASKAVEIQLRFWGNLQDVVHYTDRMRSTSFVSFLNLFGGRERNKEVASSFSLYHLLHYCI